MKTDEEIDITKLFLAPYMLRSTCSTNGVNYFVFNTETYEILQAEYSPERAEHACTVLNEHNIKYVHLGRFDYIPANQVPKDLIQKIRR